MSYEARRIRHPGPVSPNRDTIVSSVPTPLHFALEPGLAVDAAIAKGFAASGCVGGFVMLRGGTCEPFRYVIPATSPDGLHAAWFSETIAPEGPVKIERAGVIFGQRDGRPFIHCHGTWTTRAGVRMGHMLGPDTIVREPIDATGIGVKDATFRGLPDPETNFTLFDPVTLQTGVMQTEGPRVLLARVRPNEDISLAIESICSKHAIAAAKVHGIGSLNEVRFTDGSSVQSYATEVMIQEGRVENIHGRPRASLQIDVVDLQGQVFSGNLVHGDNPVCVTFELMIEELL